MDSLISPSLYSAFNRQAKIVRAHFSRKHRLTLIRAYRELRAGLFVQTSHGHAFKCQGVYTVFTWSGIKRFPVASLALRAILPGSDPYAQRNPFLTC